MIALSSERKISTLVIGKKNGVFGYFKQYSRQEKKNPFCGDNFKILAQNC